MAGKLITLEGIDGCGKSTQAALLARALELSGADVLRLREPGGTAISEKVRALLLDPANSEMGDVCELLLYEASRAQLVHEVIAPALAAGRMVVCDRFYDSTTAYQAFADGLNRNMVQEANALAVNGHHPDLTLVYDLDVEEALRRRCGRAAEDRLELKGLAFQAKVAEGFRVLASEEPARVKLVDAAQGVDEVFEQTVAELRSCGIDLSEDVQAAALAEYAAQSGFEGAR